MPSQDDADRCWRAPLSARVLVPLLFVAIFGAMAYDARDEDGTWIPPLLVMGAVSWLVWAGVLWPKLCLEDESLTIRNFGRSRSVPRGMVLRAYPHYFGIWIVQKDGHGHRAWAVQRPRYAGWIRRPTRADRVADEINRWSATSSS